MITLLVDWVFSSQMLALLIAWGAGYVGNSLLPKKE
jgi:hypothetical protein